MQTSTHLWVTTLCTMYRGRSCLLWRARDYCQQFTRRHFLFRIFIFFFSVHFLVRVARLAEALDARLVFLVRAFELWG